MTTVDISEVLMTERDAVRSLERDQPREMHRIIERAAREERRTHAYRNRTGRLERNTVATDPITTDDGLQIDLAADTEYASYVNMRGLMQIDELAQRAEEEIEFYLEGEVEKLNR